MEFKKGDQVNYIHGYKGYHAAEVVGRNGLQYIIRFYGSGLEISVWEDELEEDY